MKTKFIIFIAIVTGFNGFGQGWIGNSTTNTLYPVNSSLTTTPLNIGIGTNIPSEQLHTTAGVRFEGVIQDNNVTKILGQDNTGKLYWRDASTLANPLNTNCWSLTGNSGTSPITNFIGTTDNTNFVIRTNNLNRAVILSNGNMGVGTTNPQSKFEITNTIPDNHLRITGSAPSIAMFDGASTPTQLARIGFATAINNFVQGSKPGDFIFQTLGSGANFIFGTGGLGTGNGVERVRINPSGFFGIATNNPTATLHTNGSVRFENLPAGTGNVLVIDANGYIRRASTTARPALSEENTELVEKVKSLESEIISLRSLVNNLIKIKPTITDQTVFSITPNPANSEIRISAIVNQKDISPKKVIISDMLGNKIAEKSLSQNSTTMPVSNLIKGAYLVSIYTVNGQLLQTEKIVIQK